MNDPLLQIIFALIGALMLSFAILSVNSKRSKKREKLNGQFGQKPSQEAALDSISMYWKEKLLNNDVGNYIDGITWSDLDMDGVFSRMDACHTSVGEEFLYALLHEPVFENKALLNRETLIDTFDSDPELRLEMQVILSGMGKSNYSGLSSFCYDINSKKLEHTALFNILAALPVFFAGMIIVNPLFGVLGLLLSNITNSIVYYYTSKRIERELSAIRYFSALLWCAGKILDRCGGVENPIIENLGASFRLFRRLGGKLSGIAQRRLTDIDVIADYARIMFLTNIRHYNKALDIIEKNSREFRLLFTSLGEVDAAISILSFRKSLPFYTIPEFITENALAAQEIYHPLLSEPVPNTVTIKRNSLISGSNASGKSTFIKALAINGILAQTIHTCTARRFQTRFTLAITSMAVSDSVTAGESYFIAEIKSLKRIIDKIPTVHCLCMIDEILKGTNTIERIAASAAVLRYLINLDCLCVVATHDIELTRLLEDCYSNYHFSEQITDEGIRFDYTIKQGPTQTKNAIKLLDFLGFEKRIISDAQELVQTFENTKKWI